MGSSDANLQWYRGPAKTFSTATVSKVHVQVPHIITALKQYFSIAVRSVVGLPDGDNIIRMTVDMSD